MARDTISNDHKKNLLMIVTIIFLFLPILQLSILFKLLKQFNFKYIFSFIISHILNYLWLFVYMIVDVLSINVC